MSGAKIKARLSKNLIPMSLLMLSLAGCDKANEAVSSTTPEMQFLSSIEARWTDAASGNILFRAVDGKSVAVDSQGSILVITPTGKYDADNKMMSVKMEAFPAFDATADNTAKVLSAEFMSNGCASDVSEQQRQKINEHFKFKDVATSAYIGCLSQYVKSQGTEKLKASVSPVVASLKQNTVVPNLILFNSATDQKSVKVGLKKDDGTMIWNLGFVRKLNDDEANQLNSLGTTLQQKIVERNAMIDKVAADIVSYVEKDVANPVTSSESAAPVPEEKPQPKP